LLWFLFLILSSHLHTYLKRFLYFSEFQNKTLHEFPIWSYVTDVPHVTHDCVAPVFIICVRSEVFTAVTVKNAVIWDVTSCGSISSQRALIATYC
jgi:hypothetical protein